MPQEPRELTTSDPTVLDLKLLGQSAGDHAKGVQTALTIWREIEMVRHVGSQRMSMGMGLHRRIVGSILNSWTARRYATSTVARRTG